MRALRALAVASSAFALAWGAWWTLLCALAVRRPPTRHDQTHRVRRYVAIVPAHNEEPGVADTVTSLQSAGALLPRPPEVLVVADNCEDATARVAAGAGASVLERTDAARRGKGYALEYAIEHLRAREEPPEVVCFVDADSTVSPGFFLALDAAFEGGVDAAQAYYEVQAGRSSVTRLRRLAFMLVHWSRPLGLARLGAGGGIKGNGMALRWEVARDGLGSGGIAEDAAMTLALARRGVPVAFVSGAVVRGYMADRYEGARVQDERWEGGRLGLAGEALATALDAARRRRWACAVAALEVASPPLTLLVAVAAPNALAGLVRHGRVAAFQRLAALSLAAYVVTGLLAARARPAEVAALVHAPRFAWHKLTVLASVATGGADAAWTRTDRR